MITMFEIFVNLNPVFQALIAGCLTWGMTALGAAVVFLSKDLNRKALDCSLGFAAGIMLSASFWSLLLPAVKLSCARGNMAWVPVSAGFLIGGIFMRITDRMIPHLHIYLPLEKAEGIKTSWHKTTLLVLAMSMHNIPEGLVIGVSFGALAQALPGETLASTIALAIGIGIQDFPEGIAVSMPLYRKGVSRFKSFWYGQLSGIVEPMAALVGALAVSFSRPLLPYAMGFAAGAMIFVIIEELIPESQYGGNGDIATIGTMVGFICMMALEIMFC